MNKKIFLLLGSEIGEKKEYINILQKKATSLYGDPEKFRFYPYDTEISEIISIMMNGSLFSSHRIVIINNCEDIKKKKSINLLIEYCKKPSDDVTLILLSDENKIDSKIERLIPSSNKKIFWEMFENKKTDWIKSFFRKKKLSIDKKAIDLFLELVDNNTDSMKNDCEKLAFYFKEGTIIKEDDIENFLYHSREETVFSLFGKICKRDMEAALDILNNILLSKETQPIQILSGLLWQFRNLLSLSSMLTKKYPQGEALLKSNIRGKRNELLYIMGKKNYTIFELQKIISLTEEYDNKLRSVRVEMQESIIKMYLYHCIKKISI